MLEAYRQHVAERAALGIPPLPLSAKQTADLIELLKTPPAGEERFLLDLLTHRVPAGVDDAAKVKAALPGRGRARAPRVLRADLARARPPSCSAPCSAATTSSR